MPSAITFKQFMAIQCDEIKKHCWIESEKAGEDVGKSAQHDWIKNHAANFRHYAEKTFIITYEDQ